MKRYEYKTIENRVPWGKDGENLITTQAAVTDQQLNAEAQDGWRFVSWTGCNCYGATLEREIQE